MTADGLMDQMHQVLNGHLWAVVDERTGRIIPETLGPFDAMSLEEAEAEVLRTYQIPSLTSRKWKVVPLTDEHEKAYQELSDDLFLE